MGGVISAVTTRLLMNLRIVMSVVEQLTDVRGARKVIHGTQALSASFVLKFRMGVLLAARRRGRAQPAVPTINCTTASA